MFSNEKMLVQFIDVQDRYFIDDDKPMRIEYCINAEYVPSTKDWLGIFPRGWRELDQWILFDWAVTRPCKDNKSRRFIDVYLSILTLKNYCFYNADYQIVYISRNMQLLGRSSFFRLQRRNGDVYSQGDSAGIYEGEGAAFISYNGSVLPSYQNGTLPCSPSVNTPTEKTIEVTYPLLRPYHSECMLQFQPQSYTVPGCVNCAQHHLQKQSLLSQVKSLTEERRSLRQKIFELEQKFEISLGTQKKLKVCFVRMREDNIILRQEKEAYEAFVYELVKYLRNNSVVCLRTKESEKMIVKRVASGVSDADYQMVPLSMKQPPLNERYLLKAVIGNQEKKIQDLSMKLNELATKLSKFEEISGEIINNQLVNYNSKEFQSLKMDKHIRNKNVKKDSDIYCDLPLCYDDNHRENNISKPSNNCSEIIICNGNENKIIKCNKKKYSDTDISNFEMYGGSGSAKNCNENLTDKVEKFNDAFINTYYDYNGNEINNDSKINNDLSDSDDENDCNDNDYVRKSSIIQTTVQVHRVDEKLEATVCNVNNDLDNSDDDFNEYNKNSEIEINENNKENNSDAADNNINNKNC